MKKTFLSLALLVAGIAVDTSKAAVVFSDNMSGSFSTNWTSQTTGSGVASFSSGVLLLDNGSASGQTWAYTPTSGFSAPYSSILTNNTSNVQWAINMRTLSTDPSDSNRFAFVLAASSSNFSTASGYAIRVGGNSPSTDPFQLIYFTGGVNGTITTIASGASFTSNQYGSVNVIYNPATDAWSLFGVTGTSWTDPLAVTTQLGSTTVNTTGVNTSLTHMGVWSVHTTGAAQDRSFDNLTVALIPEPTSGVLVFAGMGMMLVVFRRRRLAA